MGVVAEKLSRIIAAEKSAKRRQTQLQTTLLPMQARYCRPDIMRDGGASPLTGAG
jgi:hypothetical protein